MKSIHVSKSKLKPKLFEYLRAVEAGETELLVTDHGEPVVKLVAIKKAEDEELDAMRGLVTSYQNPLEPLGAAWEAQT